MISFGVYFLLVCAFVIPSAQPQNSTLPPPRRSGHGRDSNIFAALQQIRLQISTLEAESQGHTSRIQEVLRGIARLEGQRQDLVNTMDRSEARIAQVLDDIKSDVRKVITLEEVIREDVDKIQQNQLLNKVSLEEQLRLFFNNYKAPEKIDSSGDTNSLIYANNDILSNLQIVQTTLHGLRRMADTLQNNINIMKSNITDLTNLTRTTNDYIKDSLITKSYLQSSFQSFLTEKEEYPQFIGCMNTMSNPANEEVLPKDCKEVQEKVQNKSGIYRIQPNYSIRPIFAYCDMETEGGGWTVIQRRKDGAVDFLREWNDYKHGFGNVGGELWLVTTRSQMPTPSRSVGYSGKGNENLYHITHQAIYELRIDLYDFDDGHAFAKYSGFAVGSEKEKYMLKLLGPLTGGDAGDGMTYHASVPFSTIDVDNDMWDGGHCARDHTGGWWYNQCDACNLNGQYLSGLTTEEYKGVYWHEWQGPSYSLMATQMMIRPITYLLQINGSSTDLDSAHTANLVDSENN